MQDFKEFTEKVLKTSYEKADGEPNDDSQLVNGEWWNPIFGCDSLEVVLEYAHTEVVDREPPEELKKVANDLMRCASSWENDVRLIGNVKARDIVRLCYFVLYRGVT